MTDSTTTQTTSTGNVYTSLLPGYQSPWVYAAVTFFILFILSLVINTVINNKLESRNYIGKLLVFVPLVFFIHWWVNVLIQTDSQTRRCQAINTSIMFAWMTFGMIIYFLISSTDTYTQYINSSFKCTPAGCGNYYNYGIKDSAVFGLIVGLPVFFLSLANRPILQKIGCPT